MDYYNHASKRAAELEKDGNQDGPQDALRHCLAGCIMARELGQTAAEFAGWVNEAKYRNQETGRRHMDDSNNACGRRYAEQAKSDADCETQCTAGLKNGDLITSYNPGSTKGPYDK
jgi:hypothetical protein